VTPGSPLRRDGRHFKIPSVKAVLSVVTALLVLLSAVPAAFADQPVTYVIDIDDIINQFGGGTFGGFVNVGATSKIIMEDPVIVIGSGVDDYESKGLEKTLSENYFRPEYILNDTARELMGRNLTDYNLILIGGPGHNAYTKYLIDNGYLTSKTTDKRMPAVIMEVQDTTPGNKVLVIGDASGYPYHRQDLPLNGIIPEEYAPAAAIAAGASIGLLGLFFSRISDLFAMLLNKLWMTINGVLPLDTVTGFIEGYVKSHVKTLLQRKDQRVRKVKADEHVALLAGFSSWELTVMIASVVLLAFAYLVAKDIDLLRGDMIVTYVIVAGVATVLHDITHRYVAWKYKAVSEYKFWGLGTIAMFATSWLFGLVYALPARTIINGADKLTKKQQAIVYLSGPSVSLILAIIFLLIMLAGGAFRTIGLIGCSMNILSAAYSLMPFDPMDGNKVYKWRKLTWVLIFLPLLAFYLVLNLYVI
jgi:hypothetical protein